ncbi:aprataxin-like protein [Drosophila grimshawi]|uniref:aprataxin-like protein n=1 Tax=Drosophila grimshawi TaxID=7222 RepID=UPI000C86F878|nr:aprataxin-like protein [Drosophila grimshawi]
MSWQTGLIKTILDPANLIISTDTAVVIADKYPKARHHYLVLPTEDIPNIFQLSKKHLPLLEEMHLLARNIIEVRGESWSEFQIGFHAQPSMQRLHLHVISKDFVSSALKTKKHWNSFNTPFFVPYETLYSRLKGEDCFQRLPTDIVNGLLASPLKCNKCEFIAKSFPMLKDHLQQHHLRKMADKKEAAKCSLTRILQKKRECLIETELAAVMKDAYPKAQYHFLVVPKEDISNVTAMTADHLQLLDHMKELANQIIEQQKNLPSSHFLIGFKIDQFMNRLCMHVISNDFYSESMRRKQHWNSFNTALFLTYQTAYALLRVQGFIEPMPEEEMQKLRNSIELRCNQCDFVSKGLVVLKAHLFTHWKEREDKFTIKDQVEKLTRILDETKLTPIAKVLEDQSQRIVPSKGQQQGDQQSPPASYLNTFASHFPRTVSNRSASSGNHQTNPNWQRANQNPHMNSNNSVFNQQFQHFSNYRLGHSPNNLRTSSHRPAGPGNHQTNPNPGQHAPKWRRANQNPQMNSNNSIFNQQFQLGHAPNNVNMPHQAPFNPFKQYPNMRQAAPNKNGSHATPQNMNNINGAECSPPLNIKQQGSNYSKPNIHKCLGSQQFANTVNQGQNPSQANKPKPFKENPASKTKAKSK